MPAAKPAGGAGAKLARQIPLTGGARRFFVNLPEVLLVIFLITTGGFFSRLSHTPGGRMYSLFLIEIPFLFSLLLWLLFDTPFFERHKWACAAAVGLLCVIGYHLQPLHYNESSFFWQDLNILVHGFGFSFFVFSGAPHSTQLRRLRNWLGRLARSLFGRFL